MQKPKAFIMIPAIAVPEKLVFPPLDSKARIKPSEPMKIDSPKGQENKAKNPMIRDVNARFGESFLVGIF